MVVLMKPVAILGLLAMYALSSIGGVKPWPQISFYETNQAIIFQMADDTKVTVGKDGKKGKINLPSKKGFKVGFKNGGREFDLEITGDMDPAQKEYTEEVVRTLLKYTDERSFVKRVGYAVKDNVAKYLRRVRGKLAVD